VTLRQSSRRKRQRVALGIPDEAMADELGITTAQLTVLEARTEAAAHEDAGRAWDLALGRILYARTEAGSEATKAAQERKERSTDALRTWSGNQKRNNTKGGRATSPRTLASA